MATAPCASLGLLIPNATFSTIGATAGLADGWNASSGITGYSSLFSVSPRFGHPRAQRLNVGSGTGGTLISSPTPANMLVGPAAIYPMRYACVYRCSFGSGSFNLTLRHKNSVGATITGTSILTIPATQTAWTLATGQVNVTIPALCHHHRMEILVNRVSGLSVVDLAFVGMGAWDSGYGYKTLAMYNHPGTYVRKSGARQELRSSTGKRRVIDGERFSRPRSGIMSWEATTAAEAALLASFYDACRGTPGRDGSGWPGGGAFPILLEPNCPTWPHALYVDFDSDELDQKPWGAWASDDGYWELSSQRFVEVL